MDVGFPVAEPVTGILADDDNVIPSELPAGKYATAALRGGYDLLPQAWPEFMDGVTTQGLKPGIPYWETYVTMPEEGANPAENVTELVVPVS